MNALQSYLRHLVVTGILLAVEKFGLPVDGADAAANVIALALVGSISWLFVKYAAPFLLKKDPSKMSIIALCLLSLGACSAQSYLVDTRPYSEQIKMHPESVEMQSSHVTPQGGLSFQQGLGVSLRTDYGSVSLGEAGLSGALVIDARSGK